MKKVLGEEMHVVGNISPSICRDLVAKAINELGLNNQQKLIGNQIYKGICKEFPSSTAAKLLPVVEEIRKHPQETKKALAKRLGINAETLRNRMKVIKDNGISTVTSSRLYLPGLLNEFEVEPISISK